MAGWDGWVADFARFPQVPARHYVLEWLDGKMAVVQRDEIVWWLDGGTVGCGDGVLRGSAYDK